MWKFFIFCSYFCSIILMVAAEVAIGPGIWSLLKIERVKTNLDKFEFDIKQRKYNRTHDMFQGSMTFHEDLNEFFGAILIVCKYVDGGCKRYQVISDDSFINMIETYALENFLSMLESTGCTEPQFPVKMGTYEIESYMWNWNDMPNEGPYGRYGVHCCVTEMGNEVGCIDLEIKYEETDDDEE